MATTKLLSTALLLCIAINGRTQVISLNSILDSIQLHHPAMKMFDAEIQSMDAAATGAKSWMPPELATGLWMTPYNTSLWKKSTDGMTGMGQYMVSAQQMIPNQKKLQAESAYMQAMSLVETQKKNATLNELFAEVKKNYFEWVIIEKKINILQKNEALLNFMIKNAEIRYKNGIDKISAYYKARAAAGNIQNMKLMLENEKLQKRVAINTLMNRDPQTYFAADTNYQFKDYSMYVFDSSTLIPNRSDIKAIDEEIHLTQLKQETERQSLKPQFGVRYDHMFGFGGLPTQFSLMGMVRLPMVKWSSKMYTAKIESLNWKSEALNQQKKMLANEYGGMSRAMMNEIDLKKKQMKLFDNNIIPALNNNYQTMLLGYEQNTEELFMLFDAWETLNMTELEYVQLIQDLLMIQVQLDSLLELK